MIVTMDIPENREIDTLEAFDALVSPRRLRLVEFYQEPATAKAAAEHLGVPVTQLYYHINMLLENELLRIVSEQKRGGMVERYFQVSARSFRPSRTFMDQYGTAGLLEVIKLTFADAELALRRAVEAGHVSLDEGDRDRVALGYSGMRLSEEGLRSLVKKINGLIHDTPDDPDGMRVGGLVAIFPRADS